jgi:hypothetical protein
MTKEQIEAMTKVLREKLPAILNFHGKAVGFIEDIAAQALAAAESAAWRDMDSAPFKQTVLLCRDGEKLCVTARRIGPVSGWRHAHTSEAICFEPTKWRALPSPPVPTPAR